LNEQAIGGIDSDPKASAALVQSDNLFESRKQAVQRVAVSADLNVAARRMKKGPSPRTMTV
jgi:hypothetical protein